MGNPLGLGRGDRSRASAALLEPEPDESGALLPEWAWIGMLRQASEDTLRSWAKHFCGPGAPRHGARAWDRAVSEVATALVQHGEWTGLPVREIQQSVLMPLELAALTSTIGPTAFVRVVLDALADRSSTSWCA